MIANANEEVVLNAIASSDPDGTIVKYTWTRLPEDKILYTGEEAQLTIKALGRAEEIVKLTVTDNTGLTSEDTISIINSKIAETAQLEARISILEEQNALLQQTINENRALFELLPQLKKDLEAMAQQTQE